MDSATSNLSRTLVLLILDVLLLVKNNKGNWLERFHCTYTASINSDMRRSEAVSFNVMLVDCQKMSSVSNQLKLLTPEIAAVSPKLFCASRPTSMSGIRTSL